MISSLPILFIAYFFYIFGLLEVKTQLKECIVKINSCKYKHDKRLIELLSIAEDIRFNYHYGIDQFAIIRALIECCKGNIQGASTIEQQLVRTLTEKYERTLLRKFREQLISHLLSLKFKKEQIANAYLQFAFYGSGLTGFRSLEIKYKCSAPNLEFLAMGVARLKYPEPLKSNFNWYDKISNRKVYILKQYTNKQGFNFVSDIVDEPKIGS